MSAARCYRDYVGAEEPRPAVPTAATGLSAPHVSCASASCELGDLAWRTSPGPGSPAVSAPADEPAPPSCRLPAQSWPVDLAGEVQGSPWAFPLGVGLRPCISVRLRGCW